ncbi:MAG: hypothetical protein PHU44_04365 [Syntrophales bacterium]|nr:hypothetical protein [Syntrophales bacterium]MDD5640270.1 hypothetical protein [Syntrophales bacterium]
MKDIASIIQTILWVGLIGAIFWRYHRQINSLLDAIQKRIEAGSGIKAGFFEISPLLSQDPEQQKKKIDEEISEVIESAESKEAIESPLSLEKLDDLRTRYFQAEDLALRAIQAEYGIPIVRQVQVGQDIGFDGFFAKGGTAHIIEVKYSQRQYRTNHIWQVLERIFARIGRYGWRNVKVILAVVYAGGSIDLEKEHGRLIEAVRGFEGAVDVRCFSLQKLAEQFGAST